MPPTLWRSPKTDQPAILPPKIVVRSCISRQTPINGCVIAGVLIAGLLAMIAAGRRDWLWFPWDDSMEWLLGGIVIVIAVVATPVSLIAVFGIPPATLELHADHIVIGRSRRRLAETMLYGGCRQSSLASGSQPDTLLEWFLRPRRWIVRRDEIQRIFTHVYGEGVLLRISTPTGSIDPFPAGDEQDVIEAAHQLIRWYQRAEPPINLNRAGQTIAPEMLTTLIDAAPDGFQIRTSPDGAKIIFRQPHAGIWFAAAMAFAIIWTVVSAIVLRTSVDLSVSPKSFAFMLAGSLPLAVVLATSGDRRHIHIRAKEMQWHRSNGTTPGLRKRIRWNAASVIRHRMVTGGGDSPDYWVVDVGGPGRSLWVGDEADTLWLARVIACASGRPLRRSAFTNVPTHGSWRHEAAKP